LEIGAMFILFADGDWLHRLSGARTFMTCLRHLRMKYSSHTLRSFASTNDEELQAITAS
jgi:hypothetical protein